MRDRNLRPHGRGRDRIRDRQDPEKREGPRRLSSRGPFETGCGGAHCPVPLTFRSVSLRARIVPGRGGRVIYRCWAIAVIGTERISFFADLRTGKVRVELSPA